MFDISARTTHEYVSEITGIKYVYRPVPHCYQLEAQQIMIKASKGVTAKSGGDVSKVQKEALKHINEAILENYLDLMLLTLRLCLRDTIGLGSKKKELHPKLIDSVVGGINTKLVEEQFLFDLLEHPETAKDIANLYDILQKQTELDTESKKKSRANSDSKS